MKSHLRVSILGGEEGGFCACGSASHTTTQKVDQSATICHPSPFSRFFVYFFCGESPLLLQVLLDFILFFFFFVLFVWFLGMLTTPSPPPPQKTQLKKQNLLFQFLSYFLLSFSLQNFEIWNRLSCVFFFEVTKHERLRFIFHIFPLFLLLSFFPRGGKNSFLCCGGFLLPFHDKGVVFQKKRRTNLKKTRSQEIYSPKKQNKKSNNNRIRGWGDKTKTRAS